LALWEDILNRFYKTLAILMLSILAACKTSAPLTTVNVPPPPLPELPKHVEPITAAVPVQLPQVNFNDPIDITILQAQLKFEKGEELYRQGFLRPPRTSSTPPSISFSKPLRHTPKSYGCSGS
jgi:hypothetical protein